MFSGEAESVVLTTLQRSMLLSSVRAPLSGAYIIQDVCEFDETLDPERLKKAWLEVAGRHSALRTRIALDPADELRASYDPLPDYEWTLLDWQTPAEEVEQYLEEEFQRGFNWENCIPIRFTLIQLPESKSILIWIIHHALLDGRSLAIVWRECLAIYDGSPLPDVEQQPREPSPADAEAFWRGYLGGVDRTSGFITDRLRTASRSPSKGIGRERAVLNEEETGALHEYARQHGFTAHTVVQGAWALLLSRYSGRSEVVFGVTRTGRSSQDSAVGMLINTLPLRVQVPDDLAAADWLQSIRAQWIAQRPYDSTPLDDVQRWAGLNKGTVPFDSVLTYDHYPPGESLRRADPQWSNRNLRRFQRTDSSLSIAIYGEPELTIEVIYDQSTYCRETMRPLASHLAELLRSLVANPSSRLSKLTMLTSDERNWLLHEVNRTDAPVNTKLRAHHLFEQQAAANPTRTAIEWADGSMSYSELNEQANRLAWQLIGQGAAPNDLIGVCMERSPLAIVAILAVLKAGAPFLPLSPDQPPDRLRAMLKDADPKLILANSSHCDMLEPYGVQTLDASRNFPWDTGNPSQNSKYDDAAYAIFTSGSTGRPKAVVLTHRSLVNHTLAAIRAYGIDEHDRRLHLASLATELIIAEVFNYLSAGATLVIPESPGGGSMSEFLRTLRDKRVTITGIPSSWWGEWVTVLEGGAEIPPSMRALLVGMERVNPGAFDTWRKLAGGKLRWFNAYGPSETSPTSIAYEAGTSGWEGHGIVPIGKPLTNMRAYVLDRHGEPVPVGIAGELYLAGEGVARGYMTDDSPRFLADPFQTGRMYRTGDLVFRLPDGNLVFVGRLDRQVKIRGFRVELEEIEAVLDLHPGVAKCAVILSGDEREQLWAYVQPAPEPASSASEWRAHLARRLPEHMIPAGFMTLNEMPVTPLGKVDRQSLPAFETDRVEPSSALREPSTPEETTLVRLWSESLTHSPIGPDDNFFELGGDSLAATRLIRSIEKSFGREMTLAALMKAPTAARMAETLAGTAEVPAADETLVVLRGSGARPPLVFITTTAVEPIGFERLTRRLDADQPAYVLPLEDPQTDVEQAVARLAGPALEELRKAFPSGPYTLGGYCLGGIVAHAVAQRLVAEGAEVRLVVLFDAPAPGYPKVLRARQNYLDIARDWLNGGTAYSLSEIWQHFAMVGKLAKRSVGRTYTPSAAGFDIVQFIARQERITTKVLEDPRLSWKELCHGEFQVFEVNASHGNLFDEPSISEIAAHLKSILERKC